MHAKYAERGLRILAFPSNQFGNQVHQYTSVWLRQHDERDLRIHPEHFTLHTCETLRPCSVFFIVQSYIIL